MNKKMKKLIDYVNSYHYNSDIEIKRHFEKYNKIVNDYINEWENSEEEEEEEEKIIEVKQEIIKKNSDCIGHNQFVNMVNHLKINSNKSYILNEDNEKLMGIRYCYCEDCYKYDMSKYNRYIKNYCNIGKDKLELLKQNEKNDSEYKKICNEIMNERIKTLKDLEEIVKKNKLLK
jgi:recombinational DNA repair ATPase RecF